MGRQRRRAPRRLALAPALAIALAIALALATGAAAASATAASTYPYAAADRVSHSNGDCANFTSCSTCAGVFSGGDGVDCVWCAGTASCVPHDEDDLCGSGGKIDRHDNCKIKTEPNTTFIIVVVALLCFCCSSCIIRQCATHMQGDNDNEMLAPLLGGVNREEAREAMFQNSLLVSGETTWLCFVCGFENWPRSSECGLCGLRKVSSDVYHDKVAARAAVAAAGDGGFSPGAPPTVDRSKGAPRGKATRVSRRSNALTKPKAVGPLGTLTLTQRLARRRHLWQIHAQMIPVEAAPKVDAPGATFDADGTIVKLSWKWAPVTDVVAKVVSQPALHPGISRSYALHALQRESTHTLEPSPRGALPEPRPSQASATSLQEERPSIPALPEPRPSITALQPGPSGRQSPIPSIAGDSIASSVQPQSRQSSVSDLGLDYVVADADAGGSAASPGSWLTRLGLGLGLGAESRAQSQNLRHRSVTGDSSFSIGRSLTGSQAQDLETGFGGRGGRSSTGNFVLGLHPDDDEEESWHYTHLQYQREMAYTPERNLSFNDARKLKAVREDTLFRDEPMVRPQPAYVSTFCAYADPKQPNNNAATPLISPGLSPATSVDHAPALMRAFGSGVDLDAKPADTSSPRTAKRQALADAKATGPVVYAGACLFGLDAIDDLQPEFHPHCPHSRRHSFPMGKPDPSVLHPEASGLYVRWVPAESAEVPGPALSLMPSPTRSASQPQAPELDLFQASFGSFHQKQLWFLKQLEAMQVPWEIGHIRLDVRRNYLLADSFTSLMELGSVHLHELLRVQFLGEPGVDAGGLEREWFTLAAQELFDPEVGLFHVVGPLNALDINPGSGLLNDLDKEYFRFAGRLLAKALMEHQTLPARLAPYLYKHLIGAPMGLVDVEALDEQLHRSLEWLLANDGADALALSFSVTEDAPLGGSAGVSELVPGGERKDVTDENKAEFVDLRVRHRLCDSIAPQLWHLKYGFHEVIPPFMVSVFDASELELLMCGLPVLDVDDWKRHTEYGGEFEASGENHRVIGYFWAVLDVLSHAERFKLLQFATGTARVPARGFKSLQSNDGNYRKFNITSVRSRNNLYPRAHTCFNKIDLPLYKDKAQCEMYIRAVLSHPVTGFTMD